MNGSRREPVPDHVRRWRRRPLLLAVPAAVLAVMLIVADLRAALAPLDPPAGSVRTTATIVHVDPEGGAVGRWRDQERGTDIEWWLTTDAPVGASVPILADPDDPSWTDTVEVVAGRMRWDWAQLLVCAMWAVPPWVWWALRHATVRRARRVLSDRPVAYRLQGVMGRAPGRRRPVLLLYPVDARPGDRPIAGVPVIPGDGRYLGEHTVVDALGVPAPGAFLVPLAVADGGTENARWPAGRAVVRATVPWSDEPGSWRTGRPSPWPVITATLLALAAVVMSLVADRGDQADRDRILEQGTTVDSTVVGVTDETEYWVLYRVPGDDDLSRVAWIYVSSPTRDAPHVGDTRRVVVDPETPDAVEAGDAGGLGMTIATAIIALIAVAVTAAVSSARRASVEGIGPLTIAPPVATPTDDPSGQEGSFAVPVTSRHRGWTATGLHLRPVGGVLTAGGSFHLLPWRWQARLTPDGLDLIDRRGHRRLLGWDVPWTIEGTGARFPALEVHLPTSGGRTEVFTLTGEAGIGAVALQALTDHLRAHPDSRLGLADPVRCRALAAALADWSRPLAPSLRAPAVDQLIAERVGNLSHGRRLPPTPSTRQWAVDELTDDVMANLNSHDRGRVKRRWVQRRVRRVLSQDPWPFHLLTGTDTPDPR